MKCTGIKLTRSPPGPQTPWEHLRGGGPKSERALEIETQSQSSNNRGARRPQRRKASKSNCGACFELWGCGQGRREAREEVILDDDDGPGKCSDLQTWVLNCCGLPPLVVRQGVAVLTACARLFRSFRPSNKGSSTVAAFLLSSSAALACATNVPTP